MKRLASASVLFGFAVVLATHGSAQQPAASQAGQPTFTKDVAPILQRSCQKCHRPGSMAPMSFLTYDDVRPWARAIKTQVTGRQMPPWYIDRTVGVRQFDNDPSLSDVEIATISRWWMAARRAGTPPTCRRQRTSKTRKPGTSASPISSSSQRRHTIPATGSDWWGDYIVDTGLTEDRYLKAVRNQAIVWREVGRHHAVTFLIQDEGDGDAELIGRTSDGGLLNEYAVGKNGDVFPEGTGRLVKAGAKVRFNMHYHPNGEEKIDQSEVALVFYPKGYVPKYYLFSAHTGDTEDLDIPAGTDNVRSDGYSRLNRNARITSFQPHLHNRGKAQCIEALYPDGPAGDAQLRQRLQVRLAHRLQLQRAGAAAPAGGHDSPRHQLAQQHGVEPLQPRSEKLGRLRAAIDRRHELRVGQLHLAHGRRLQQAGRRSPRAAVEGADRAAVTP
jgi:hypothetical protein